MPAQQRLPDQVGPSMPSMSERKNNCSNDCNIFLLVGIYIIVGREKVAISPKDTKTNRLE